MSSFGVVLGLFINFFHLICISGLPGEVTGAHPFPSPTAGGGQWLPMPEAHGGRGEDDDPGDEDDLSAL